MPLKKHDLIIIGAGPAGLSAAIYAARYHIDFEIIGELPGGYMSEATEIENYPGVEKISGRELTERMVKQLSEFGHDVTTDNIEAITKTKDGFKLIGEKGSYEARYLLLALGTERNKLNIPGESELAGRGVSYCATCDGPFFSGKKVAVVGGGDTAIKAALHLADIAEKVYVVVRRDELRCEPATEKKLCANKKIEVVYETKIKEIKGDEKVESILLDGDTPELAVDGVFIEIGHTPVDVLTKSLGVKVDDQNYIVVDGGGKTNIASIWAAGDATTGSNGLAQIVTACSEGAVAASDIFSELKKSK